MPQINVGINARGAERGAKRVVNALGSIGRKASSVVKTAFNPLNVALTTLVSGAGIVGLAKVADKYTIMATQLEYVTGSAQDAAYAQDELYQISKLTGTQMEDNAGTLVKLQQASAMTGLTMGENLQVIKGLNSLMIKTGTSGIQASNAMLQLSQALTSGKLSGDEFRSMAENAPGVLNEMSKAMGIARSDLKEMSTQGELTSDRLGAALLSIAQDTEKSMGELPETVHQGWNSVILSFERAWDIINDDTGIMGYFRTALISLSEWIEEKTPEFSQWFLDMVENIRANAPEIIDSLYGVRDSLIELYNSAVDTLPSMQQFFVNVGYVAQQSAIGVQWFIEKIQWIFDNWAKIQSTFGTMAAYNPLGAGSRAAGTLAGGGSLGDAFGAAFDAEGGAAIYQTNNFSTPLSANDVTKVTTEQSRQASQL